MNMNERIKQMLIVAYSSGYEAGHHDTVEGSFQGNGRSDEHHEMAAEIIDQMAWDGSFEFSGSEE
jgi:hypothetical protein